MLLLGGFRILSLVSNSYHEEILLIFEGSEGSESGTKAQGQSHLPGTRHKIPDPTTCTYMYLYTISGYELGIQVGGVTIWVSWRPSLVGWRKGSPLLLLSRSLGPPSSFLPRRCFAVALCRGAVASRVPTNIP